MRLSMLFGLLMLVGAAFILPSVAQDKKEPAKEAKKDEVKKDDAKKDDDKKDTPKKDESKDEKPSKKSDAKPPEEKVEYGQMVTGKIKVIEQDSAKDMTLEVQVPDPKKIYDFNVWKAQQTNQLRQGKPNPQAIASYQKELIRRQGELTSPKDFQIRVVDGVKVRTNFLPLEYDDKGFPKKYTAKEVAAMKSKVLPGYPSDFDAVKVNQIVQVYLAKTAAAPASKGSKATKKADDDVELTARPDVVMIVIVGAGTSP